VQQGTGSGSAQSRLTQGNIQASQAWTSLMYAASRNESDTVSAVLKASKNQIDLNQRDSNGRTCVMVAAEEGHLKTLEVLLKHIRGLHQRWVKSKKSLGDSEKSVGEEKFGGEESRESGRSTLSALESVLRSTVEEMASKNQAGMGGPGGGGGMNL
jgi:ankyrin repeat protein